MSAIRFLGGEALDSLRRLEQLGGICIIALGMLAGCNSTPTGGVGESQPELAPATVTADCNSNGIPDDVDISGGPSTDCNQNGVPDECDRVHPELRQWASGVTAYSSQFGGGGWSAAQVIGEPDVFNYGDVPRAWAPRPRNGSLEFVQVTFDEAVYARAVTIRETYGNGMVAGIEVLDAAGDQHVVWEADDPSAPGQPVDFRVDFPQTAFAVRAVIVHTDTDTNPATWEEIDAIALHGVPLALADCNSNGVADGCDPDSDADGIPDDCDTSLSDCNSNGTDDARDIAAGSSRDCNANTVPDECDLGAATSFDCDGDGQLDECDPDCNFNGASDVCEVLTGARDDCDQDGVPDECGTDRDDDGFVDGCDACPDSDTTATLVINGCNTNVANNPDATDGCMLADAITSCTERSADEGEFVGCVTDLAEQWHGEGRISRVDQSRMVRCAYRRAGAPGLTGRELPDHAGGGTPVRLK